MEKNELVLRIRDENDRRVVRIHLLPEGERVIEEVIIKRQDYLRDLTADEFNEEEFDQLLKNLQKLHRDVITEETIFKDEDEREAPVIKYEPETIKELRDKELEPAFMKKEEEEKIEKEKDKKEESTFDKYRENSFDREDEDMKIEEIKQNMIIVIDKKLFFKNKKHCDIIITMFFCRRR